MRYLLHLRKLAGAKDFAEDIKAEMQASGKTFDRLTGDKLPDLEAKAEDRTGVDTSGKGANKVIADEKGVVIGGQNTDDIV